MVSKINIANVPVSVLTEKMIESEIDKIIDHSKTGVVLYANSNSIQLANYQEKWLIECYKSADMVLCDGAGIQFGAKITRQVVPEKIAFNLWFWNFLKFIEIKYSIFLLGGSEDVIRLSCENFLRHVPKLRIVGCHHGYFDKRASIESDTVIQIINREAPDILLVGFGQPMQEKWIWENQAQIKAGVIMACGGAFDFFSGRLPVAPSWIRALNLEWLFRLLQEPKRLFRRYTVGNYYFVKLVVKQRLGIS